MDRDKRYDRIKKAYDAMAYSKGIVIDDYKKYINDSYKNNITDEIRTKAKNKLYSIFGQYDELEIKDL